MSDSRPVLVPVTVPEDDFDQTVEFYEHLMQTPAGSRIPAGPGEIQARPVGSLLIVSGSGADVEEIGLLKAIVVVADLEADLDWALQHGGIVVTPPARLGDSTYVRVRHATGEHVEYLQFDAWAS